VVSLRSDEEILAELKKASAGLFVMSESDYPFEIIQWTGVISITPEYLLGISGKPAESPIEKTGIDDFFNVSGKFPHLVRLLKDRLTHLEVYKVGTINIPVYIVGRSPEGNWLGLSTRLVQT
jgi:hypothetical protein